MIKYKRWRYEVSKAAGTVSIHETMKPEDIPEDIRKIKARINEFHLANNLSDDNINSLNNTQKTAIPQ